MVLWDKLFGPLIARQKQSRPNELLFPAQSADMPERLGRHEHLSLLWTKSMQKPSESTQCAYTSLHEGFF